MLHFKNSWLIERLSLVFLRTFKSQDHPYFRAIEKKISERLIALEKVKKP
jgi:hypothetical protein